MTYCEYCGDQISYLPFNCKYCGGTYCKKHRLPENHECSFELKHVSIAPPTSMETRRRYQEGGKKKNSKVYLEKGPKYLKKYLKRQEKQSERLNRAYQKPYGRASQYQGTKILFIMIIIFSIVALGSIYYFIPQYIFFSLNGLVYEFTYHTLFTSLFVSGSDIFELFFLFIMLFFLYFMARNIESNLGTKFLYKLFIVSGLFSALFYVLLRITLISFYPLDLYPFYVGLAWGGILGILSYSLFPIMNQRITAMMYFLPIRMRGRSLLIIIILLRIFPVLIFGWANPYYILFYLPDLGGVLGAYILYRFQYRNR